jgi:2,4-diaminopentanoate dehydrogenase
MIFACSHRHYPSASLTEQANPRGTRFSQSTFPALGLAFLRLLRAGQIQVNVTRERIPLIASRLCFIVFAPNLPGNRRRPRRRRKTPRWISHGTRATEHNLRKKIRAVQYGVGPIGAAIVRLMREKDAIEIIGAIDSDPAKAGRDLGDAVEGADAPWGVPVTSDADAMLGESPDVIIHSTSSYLPTVMDQLLACLAAESCVISTCEELAYPFRKYPELSAKLDAEAKTWGVALIGTGINPGYVMDKLLITLSAASQSIESARAVRVVDASKRRLPLQKKVGAGMTVEEFRAQVAAGAIKHHGLPESVAMVSDALGLDVQEISETIDPVVAREVVKTQFLEVTAGQVAGVHQIARGYTTGGQEKIYMELQMFVGATDPRDSVEIKGNPNLTLTIPGGTHGDIATASVVVNCVPGILDAPAGLRTSRDLPMCFFPPDAKP